MDWLELLRFALPFVAGLVLATGFSLLERLVGGDASVGKGSAGERFVLRYSRTTRAGAILCGVFVTAVGCWLIFEGQTARDWETKTAFFVFGGVTAVSVPLIVFEVFRYRLVLTHEGLSRSRFLRFRPLVIAWRDVRNVMYFQWDNGLYLVEGADGKSMWLRHSLAGFEYFALACRKWLAPAMYDQTFNNGGVPSEGSCDERRDQD